VEVVQTYRPLDGSPRGAPPFRGGATLIVDLASWDVRYIIYKRLYERLPDQPGGAGTLTDRFRRQRADAAQDVQGVWQGEDTGDLGEWLAATYACRERIAARRTALQDEPFALLHRTLE
jgi:hypothetical protein